MTPQQFTKLRRIDTMRVRLKKPRDPHLAQSQAYYFMMQDYMGAQHKAHDRQNTILEELLIAVQDKIR